MSGCNPSTCLGSSLTSIAEPGEPPPGGGISLASRMTSNRILAGDGQDGLSVARTRASEVVVDFLRQFWGRVQFGVPTSVSRNSNGQNQGEQGIRTSLYSFVDSTISGANVVVVFALLFYLRAREKTSLVEGREEGISLV